MQSNELREIAEADGVEAALEKAVTISGSADVFRELGQLCLFCARMKFSNPEQPQVGDDPIVPVYPWCRADGRSPAITLSGAADLYLRWIQEVMPKFRQLHPHLKTNY